MASAETFTQQSVKQSANNQTEYGVFSFINT